MCFIIHTTQPYSDEQTANADIVVYKVIQSCNRSLHLDFQYAPNLSYRLRKKLKVVRSDSIDKGFHSYSSFAKAKRRVFHHWKAVKFIIPKGAKYYYNPDHDEYVSSSIRSGDLVAL